MEATEDLLVLLEDALVPSGTHEVVVRLAAPCVTTDCSPGTLAHVTFLLKHCTLELSQASKHTVILISCSSLMLLYTDFESYCQLYRRINLARNRKYLLLCSVYDRTLFRKW